MKTFVVCVCLMASGCYQVSRERKIIQDGEEIGTEKVEIFSTSASGTAMVQSAAASGEALQRGVPMTFQTSESSLVAGNYYGAYGYGSMSLMANGLPIPQELLASQQMSAAMAARQTNPMIIMAPPAPGGQAVSSAAEVEKIQKELKKQGKRIERISNLAATTAELVQGGAK